MSSERCHKMRFVQYRVDNQPCRHRMYTYVCTSCEPFKILPFICAYLSEHFLGNICTCENGVEQTGADCPTNGAAKCDSCDTGWTISLAKTACSGTCTRFRVCERSLMKCVCARIVSLRCSERLHMQQRRGGNRTWLPRGRCCEMRGV